MEQKHNNDIWLDYVMAKASWPEPSADLECRIMQRIDRDYAMVPQESQTWRSMSLAALVLAGFAAGFFYQSPAAKNMVYSDAAYYSDAHFVYSNILGS